MNSTHGFYISKLCFEGANRTTAVMEFKEGCNVISGASDTGKTYILQCIDFLFGAGGAPKEIPEAHGYQYIFLELKSRSGKTVTLMRDLKEADKTYLKEGPVENFWDFFKENKLDILTSTKKNAKDKKSVSDVLLELSGFTGTEKIRVNADNKKRSISFRDISHLVVIDEEKIIAEASPVYHIGITQSTTEEDVFNFVLSGKDSSHIEEVPNPKKRKAELRAQMDLIDDLTSELSHKISQQLKMRANLPDTSIDEDISKIEEQYVEVEKSLASKRKERKLISESIDKHKLEVEALDELIKRFALLESQYKSDLDRLDFLGEGEHFISQLSDTKCICPLCGSSLDSKDAVKPETRIAIAAESKKISKNLKELGLTIEANKSQRDILNLAVDKLKRDYNRCEEEIVVRLQPFKSSIQSELQKLVAQQKEMLALNTFRKQLIDLSEKKKILEAQFADVKKQKGSSGTVDKKSLESFIDEVRGLLMQWKYLSSATVIDFDTAKGVYDIETDGNSRVSHGKGVRALLYSAFVLGLMLHCKKNNLAHPLLLLLDTPVNAFRDKDPEIKDEQQADQIIEAFYESVARLPPTMQLIVFENQEPSAHLHEKIHYQRFSGNVTVGRQGFIPPENK